MITSVGQIMLYVNDTKRCATFWHEQVGFERIESFDGPGGTSYLVAPTQTSDVQLVLHNRAAVQAMQPEMDLATPSILLSSKDLAKTHQQLADKGVAVNPIVTMGTVKTFNFPDVEGNYFAVQEIA